MIFAIYLVLFLASYKLFSYKFYPKLRPFLAKTYVVPRRFYFYFLFLLTLFCFGASQVLFREQIQALMAFAIIYSLSCSFLFVKGFKMINYLVIAIVEKCVKVNLLLFSVISVVAVILIFYSILTNSFLFFEQVGVSNFLFKTNWEPENYEFDAANSFGIIPLVINTLYITLFSVLVSFFFGLFIAIYLSEYVKSKNVRFLMKSSFEIVAGIPSIFYGFFGAFILAPNFVQFFGSIGLEVSIESIIIPGIAIGIMMIPYVTTLLDDAFSSVPKTLKDASIAMGLTKFETVMKLIFPISMPEIISTLIIVISRVLGETMVVLLTCGIVATMTLNPFMPSTTITVQIVHLLTGDTSFESTKTLSVFALSLFLFIATMILNIISIRVKNSVKN